MSRIGQLKRYIYISLRKRVISLKSGRENDICDKAILDISKGNKEKLSDIYDCMAGKIFLSAYAVTGNYNDAEDVLQETMIQIIKYSGTYKRGTNAKAWIMTMAQHKTLDIVRKRKQLISVDDVSLENELGTSQDNSDMEVYDMLRCLEDTDKQLVLYRLYWDMSYIEIAGIMDISVYSAQKRYQRAIKKLRKQIL